jgi:hypothetical protein
LSVGWCPSKRVVVIHYARPYTAQKVSGGCVTAISGSASKFAEDTCYENGDSEDPLPNLTSVLDRSPHERQEQFERQSAERLRQ